MVTNIGPTPSGTVLLLISAMGAGCSAVPSLSDSSLAGYTAANAVITAGHTERQIDPQRYHVSANGTETTPATRVKRIAMARAAEIGVEEKLPFFRINDEAEKVTCRARQEFHRGHTVPAARYTTVTLDVSYAKGPVAPDAGYQPSAATFERLKADIDGEHVPADTLAATAAAHKAACGN